MCTVSYINTGKEFVFTSSRDEKINRPIAFQPEKLTIEDVDYYFAKDPKAHGTWFVTDNKGNVAILLNGAFEKHISTQNYAKSRGIVLLELFYSQSIIESFQQYSLENIEPFQLIVFSNKLLIRLVWDGNQKHCIELDKHKSYIFSSATLYTPEIRLQRENWFADYLSSVNTLSKESIFDFHKHYNASDCTNGLVIDRVGEHKTYSISQVAISHHTSFYTHFDMATKNDSSIAIELKNQSVVLV